MKMKNLLLILALMALPLAAQNPPKDIESEIQKLSQVQRLFVLKYADPNQVSNLIRVFTGNVTPNAAMHAIAVSASPEAMAAIEDAIKRLDVPASALQNVELTAYLLTGSDTDGTSSGSLPKELDSVVTQLKAAFAYRSYKLGDILTLRGRTGQRLNTTGMGGSVTIGGAPLPIYTDFQIESLSIGADGAIRIDNLRVNNRVPVGTGSQTQNLALTTDLDIKEGQKVVVGKMALNPNEAMFLVLMAHIAQ
jgi:hypothetical protein